MQIGIESNILRYLLKDAFFINGTAYAGKSTAVRLLAERFDGICMGENYHDSLMAAITPDAQPNLSYFDIMQDWQEFIHRTPEAYEAWIRGCSEEAAALELMLLVQRAAEGKRMFVDTNIPLPILREITDDRHVAILLSPESMSVDRFFEREDADKQFLLRQIRQAKDPAFAMQNFLACIRACNDRAHYEAFRDSGFFVLVRDEHTTVEQTQQALIKHFGLDGIDGTRGRDYNSI